MSNQWDDILHKFDGLSIGTSCSAMKSFGLIYVFNFEIIASRELACDLQIDFIRKYTCILKAPPLLRNLRYGYIATGEETANMIYPIYPLPPLYFSF